MSVLKSKKVNWPKKKPIGERIAQLRELLK